jgi:acetyl-CoA synthetase
MPMTIELVVAFLATIKVGGVVLPLFSGYGPSAVATRLFDAEARFLFVSDGLYRRGKVVNLKAVADEALVSSPVERVIVHRRTGVEVQMHASRDVWWSDVVPQQADRAETVDTSAEDRLMIIYTSGTTGKPKGAVHTHCGFPIKGAQDMHHAMDVKPGDVVYWMSDMGWMMGPWLVFGTLVIGATMVLYDGAPDFPSVDRTWSLVARHRVTHLGLSPVLIRALMPHGTEPVGKHNLSTLRAVCSTGSPWDPESWLWTFNNILDRRNPILNYSGGTEISGGILCGNLFRPLKPCAFSGPVPGMDAAVVDDNGESMTGRVGELVIRQPWIGMTRGFWNDEQRYVESYWSKFANVWVHGDFAIVDDDGLWYVLGRSDDTIKVAGKRVGPAEVEAVVNGLPLVAECAAVGVPDPVKGESLVVFCVLTKTEPELEALRSTIRSLVADALGRPLKPSGVFFVESLPKTRNAKVMRRLVRAAHLRLDLGNTTALENEESIEHIRAAR